MLNWPRYPRIFEINTWVWLTDLSRKYGTFVELASVPSAEWDAIARYGFDAVWLMGVWERSPAGTAIANSNQVLIEDFRRALPDFHPDENVGSPYCVRRYVVDEMLGGPGGLCIARRELAARGIRLILDFVPNHVAPDHPWVATHPEYFIQGNREDARIDPSSYLDVKGRVIACGRDPYFPAWKDVLQLNAFDVGLRRAARETMLEIASQSDGVRCDMAMLFLNPVFERTWTHRAGPRPGTEYWGDVITSVKAARPDYLFIAEAYWDLEWELQRQGFDFCYDKRLYDRMEHSSPESVRLHLCADMAYQDRLIRFLENHDEPRSAAVFSAPKERAAAVALATLPGARLFYEGQFEGRKVRPPVFLSRRPDEPVDMALLSFYQRLLASTCQPIFQNGEWSLCERNGWPDNTSFLNVLCWQWVYEEEQYVVVINLSDQRAQAHVHPSWPALRGETLRLFDAISQTTFERNTDEVCREGLYVDLDPWGFHFFHCQPTSHSVHAFAA